MHGGARQNAGRKKGATNTKTAIERAAIREKVDAIKAEGETPLEVLLRIMRSASDESTVIDCAKAAAPYIHPKLANIEHSGNQDNPLTFTVLSGVTRDEPDQPKANGRASH